MNHDYKYENLPEEQRLGLIRYIRESTPAPQSHCQCRSGSPDTCPKCTDMETGEKFTDLDKDELEVFPTCPRPFKHYNRTTNDDQDSETTPDTEEVQVRLYRHKAKVLAALQQCEDNLRTL